MSDIKINPALLDPTTGLFGPYTHQILGLGMSSIGSDALTPVKLPLSPDSPYFHFTFDMEPLRIQWLGDIDTRYHMGEYAVAQLHFEERVDQLVYFTIHDMHGLPVNLGERGKHWFRQVGAAVEKALDSAYKGEGGMVPMLVTFKYYENLRAKLANVTAPDLNNWLRDPRNLLTEYKVSLRGVRAPGVEWEFEEFMDLVELPSVLEKMHPIQRQSFSEIFVMSLHPFGIKPVETAEMELQGTNRETWTIQVEGHTYHFALDTMIGQVRVGDTHSDLRTAVARAVIGKLRNKQRVINGKQALASPTTNLLTLEWFVNGRQHSESWNIPFIPPFEPSSDDVEERQHCGCVHL